ncbi:ribose 5-phosphate isomerase A [Tanacetum coccineum]
MDTPRQPHMQKLRQLDMPIGKITSADPLTIGSVKCIRTPSSEHLSMDEQDEIDEYEIHRDGNFLRTQTMTTKEGYKPNEGEMIVVPFNDLNQPIKSVACLFTRFMTLLVKEPKGDLTFLEYTDDEILQTLDLVEAPHYFVDHQWESYKDHLRAPKTKKVKYKREPDYMEIFEMDHVTKLGSYVHDRSRVLASKAKAGFANKLFEVGISERDDPEKRLEIAREVMQELRPPKKNGRPCGYGVGVTKSQVTKFSFDLRRMRRQGVSSENRFLLNKVAEQSKQIEKQSRKMNMMEENMTKFIGELKTMLPDLFATRTSKTQLFYGSCEDRT